MKNRYLCASVTWSNLAMENCWDNELAEKFLNLNPRSTVAELRLVLYGSRIGFNFKDPYRAQGYVPNPQNPEKWKYDTDEIKGLY
jgi:hypothetical protein